MDRIKIISRDSACRCAILTLPVSDSSQQSCRLPAPTTIQAVLVNLELCYKALTTAAECLSAEERDRAARFAANRERRRYLLAHTALRITLADYFQCPPADVIFTHDALGRPSIAAPTLAPALSFSLSHSGEYALIAYGHCLSIGADIEVLRDITYPEELASTIISPIEREFDIKWDSAALIRIWTVKEAILKATGEGLNRPMSELQLKSWPSEQPVLKMIGPSFPQGTWHLRFYEVLPGIAMALAAWGDNPLERIAFKVTLL